MRLDELNDNKKDLLLSFLIETRNELRNWRERNWNAMKYTLTGIFAIAGTSIFKSQLQLQSALIVIISISGILYLLKNQDRYKECRITSRNIEELLGFHSKEFFGTKVVHTEEKQRYPHFIMIIIMAALSSIAILYIKENC